MSLSIFDHGEGRFRLFHGEHEVGWVDGRHIGFSGFATTDAARRGATVAYDALSQWLARQLRTDASPRSGRRLGLRRDGDEKLLTLGGVPIGQLIQAEAGDGAHAFQLLLPPRVVSLAAAQVIDGALRRHRALHALETAGATESGEAVA